MPLTPGQILNNRYRIVSLLGQGGFGAVYRAWDLNLSRPCAVKENLDTSPEAQKQFGREAVLLANLSHPNLVRVSDYFFLPGQGQYFVMDFVEGKDLDQMLQAGGPLPLERVLPWADQICAALEYLHSQKQPVIHRDLKPANIKIDPEGNAILVDFGIAKIYDPQLRTTQGARAVTPGYSPPEQYGQGHTDTRTDIYALGATLYTALTGIVPPDSVDIITGNAPALTLAHLVNPHIPPRASRALVKAMNVQRTERFASMTEFRQALSVSLPASTPAPLRQAPIQPTPALAPAQNPPVSASYQAPAAAAPPVALPGAGQPGSLRRKIPWVIGAAGGVIGLCLLGWVIYQNIQPEPAPEEEVARPEPPLYTEEPVVTEEIVWVETEEWLLPEPTQVEVFSWWTGGREATGLDALIDVFHSQYPDIEFINATLAGGAGTNARAVLATRLQAGDPPDIWQGHAGQELIGTYVSNEQIEPLNFLYEDEGWLDQLPATLIPHISQRGSIYSVPVSVFRTNVLWYNPAILEANNIAVPTMLEDWFAAMDTLQAAGIPPLALGEQWTALHLLETILLASLGPDAYNGLWDGTTDWNSGEVAWALQNYTHVLQYTNSDAASLSWQDAAQLVGYGQAAFYVTGGWTYEYYRELGLAPGVDFAWAPVPGTVGSFQFLADSFVLASGAPHRAAALDWLSICGSRQGQDAFNTVRGSSIPARLDADPSLYDIYQQFEMRDWAYNIVVGSLTHGVTANDTWKSDIDSALGIFLTNRDIASFQSALAAACQSSGPCGD